MRIEVKHLRINKRPHKKYMNAHFCPQKAFKTCSFFSLFIFNVRFFGFLVFNFKQILKILTQNQQNKYIWL